MPKIRMLETALGADAHDDGRTHGVKEYAKGETHEVGEELARAFCEDMKVAELADVSSIKAKKNLGPAPENKAAVTTETEKLPRFKKA